jgi:hypothetical protein
MRFGNGMKSYTRVLSCAGCRVSSVAASAVDHVKGKMGRRWQRTRPNKDDDPQLLADLPWPPLLLLHRSLWPTLSLTRMRACACPFF